MNDQDNTVLIVEDDTHQRQVLAGFLRKRGFAVLEASDAEKAMAIPEPFALLLTDLRLGGTDGIGLLDSLKQRTPDIQGIVLTAYGTVEDATRAMKAGAYDFLTKPVDLVRLETLVQKALEKVCLARENRHLAAMVENADAFTSIVGEDPALKEMIRVAAKAAASKASILIEGESGTGKEVLARAIHQGSPRRTQSFVTVNCAALPETLIESELFGYEPGAFTGATRTRAGRFEQAAGGTLFLDEIGEIPLPVQVKLLNVLQDGSLVRLGGQELIRPNVRVVAATNKSLKAEVAAGRFREDLYYRLNVVSLLVPPLRRRIGDIPLLAHHLIQKHAALAAVRPPVISGAGMAALQRYGFPGNVRELENWIERALVLSETDILEPADFPSVSNAGMNDDEGADTGLEGRVAALEKSLISKALVANHYNQSAAARELRISERTIRYKIKKYGL